MNIVKGKIGMVWQNKNNYTVSIGEDRLEVKGEGVCPFISGQDVELTCEPRQAKKKDGTPKIVYDLAKGNGTPAQVQQQLQEAVKAEPVDDQAGRIIRSVVCKAVVPLMPKIRSPDAVKVTANMWEKWIYTGEWE